MALTSALLPAVAVCQSTIDKSAAGALGANGAPASAGADGAVPFALHEATVTDLQDRMAKDMETARSLSEKYLERIKALNEQGPMLRAVIKTNPDALKIADGLAQERKAGKVRGPLHGIPVLIKDNGDHMMTTAGASALLGYKAKQDTFIVQKLRAAGAVLLGKTNLRERVGRFSVVALGERLEQPRPLKPQPVRARPQHQRLQLGFGRGG